MEEMGIVKIEEECNVWLEKAKATEITDEKSLLAADVLVKDIKRHRTKTVEVELGPTKDAATKAWQAACDLWNKYVNPLKAAEKAIKDEMILYSREQDRIRQEAEDKARQEAEDKAQSEREQLEKEALAAMDKGDEEEAEIKAAQAEEVSVHNHMPVTQPAPSTPKGTTVKDAWKAEVTDLWALIQAVAKDKNLINALQADTVYLGQRARSDKESLKIPGVRVYNAGSVSIRA